MNEHKFKIGQTVKILTQVSGGASPDRYEVVRLLPAETNSRFDYQYRLKKLGSAAERIVKQSEIA